jgi:hypothetical protein
MLIAVYWYYKRGHALNITSDEKRGYQQHR